MGQIHSGSSDCAGDANISLFGVVVQLPLKSYVTNNICPLITQLQQWIKQWMELPIDLMGRVNLFEVICLLKLLYAMANSP